VSSSWIERSHRGTSRLTSRYRAGILQRLRAHCQRQEVFVTSTATNFPGFLFSAPAALSVLRQITRSGIQRRAKRTVSIPPTAPTSGPGVACVLLIQSLRSATATVQRTGRFGWRCIF